MNPQLTLIVEEKLKLQWSPVQISGRLKTEEAIRISPETIYQHIWNDKQKRGFLYKYLHHKGKKYSRRSKVAAGRGCIPNRVDIDQRPRLWMKKHELETGN